MNTENKNIVYSVKCPVCGVPTMKAMNVSGAADDAKPTLWYHCSCDVLFQKDYPNPPPRDKAYNKRFLALKEYEDVSIHLAKTYMPVIEECTMGRKALEVGFGTGHNMTYLKERGWVTFGIERNKDTVESDRIIKDDFELTDKLYKNTYDLVWMGYVLHKFKNPIEALKKAKDILQDDGVLFISTADIDFLYTKPVGNWLYWNGQENYIFWSIKSLVRELEKLGFNVILKRRNYSSRYGYYFDLHIIAQKQYF